MVAALAEADRVLGRSGCVDAVAVYANFSMMTRVADGTGTPLDAGTAAMSESLRTELDLNTLASARRASS